MKKPFLPPAIAAVAGAAAFVLRLLQRKMAFEPATGLPLKNHPLTLAPIILLLAAGIVLFLLARKLPRNAEDAFPASFSTADAAALTLPVMGILLMLLSGLLSVVSIVQPGLIPGTGALSSTIELLFAATAILPAAALFSAVVACRVREDDAQRIPFDSTWLLAPPVCFVVRLVLSYRVYSVNPVLEMYYAEVLALALMTLAFYQLASFAFANGRSSRFVFYSGLAVVLCLAALGGSNGFADLLLYAGGALTLLGFLLLHLQKPIDETK